MVKSGLNENEQSIYLRKHLIRGAFGSLFLKLSQTLLTFVLAIILARTLGAKGFGIYAFCISILNILTIPAMLGGQNLLVREVAAYKAQNQFQMLRGLLGQIKKTTTLASVTITFFTICIGYWTYKDSPVQIPFLIAMAALPLMAAMNLQGALIRGLNYIVLGRLNLALLPLIVILIISALYSINDFLINPTSVLLVYGISTACIVLFFHLVILKIMPTEVKMAIPSYESSRWIKSMWPFVFAGGMQVFNKEASIILLGIMQDSASVGLYRIAQRGADLIPFGLLAVNMAIAPTISELYSKGEMQRLQNIVSKSIIAIVAFALPVGLFLMLSSKWIVPFIFGQEYAPASVILVVLCIGQIINACTGSSGVIMSMIGMERLVARGTALASIVAMLLNIILISKYGAFGAAIATSTGMICLNLMLFGILYKKTKIFSAFRLERKK